MIDAEIRTAYRDHKDAIYRFAWRMTGSAEAAEDILQECFLSLLRNPDNYSGERGPLRAFLFAVARNLGRKRWRSEQRWGQLQDEEEFVAQPLDPSAAQTADLVAKAVQSLPPLQREATGDVRVRRAFAGRCRAGRGCRTGHGEGSKRHAISRIVSLAREGAGFDG